jgi:hypothetical protein
MGEPNDPYQIATAADLIALGETPGDYDKCFILTADIDLDPKLPGRKVFDKAVIAPTPATWGKDPPFAGVFDGQGHMIKNLRVTGGSNLGVFGHVGDEATVSNLGLEAVEVSDLTAYGQCTGGLVGWNEGSIVASYSSGSVKGRVDVGGLVGYNLGSISSSDSNGSVSGASHVGGLAGCNYGGIIASYSKASVNGDGYVGGLVGENGGSIVASYGSGPVKGTGGPVGGLVGSNGGSITSSYSTGSVSGTDKVGGLVGDNWGSIDSSFWDIQTSGQTTSAGGTGKTTAEMQRAQTFLDAGWDLVEEVANGTCDYWQIAPGDYPWLRYQGGNRPSMPQGRGTAEQPYLIRDARDLGTVSFAPGAHYCLARSIDLSGMTWSIGVIPWFGGNFDGAGYVVTNLHIQGGTFLGLFGMIASTAKISNLRLEAVEVRGTDNVGGLAGRNEGFITDSYSSGSISGIGSVGGLVGTNYNWVEGLPGSIANSYSTGAVSGKDAVGGLVGTNLGSIITSCSNASVSGSGSVGGLVGNQEEMVGLYCLAWGNITNSYSAGAVSGGSAVGGLVGSNGWPGSIAASYSSSSVIGKDNVGGLVGSGGGEVGPSFWDTQTSGQSGSAGGAGLTTAEMMDPYMLGLNGFANDPNWVLDAGRDYPRLAWQGTPGRMIPEANMDWLAGQGTADSPYRIDTADQLIFLGKASILWNRHFVLAADIDLNPALPGRQIFPQAVIPVFTGVFDGGGHVISHLTIQGGQNLGLFGSLMGEAQVRNIGVGDIEIIGSGDNVGGLAGVNLGSITSSYSSGAVSGSSSVGGLAGSIGSFFSKVGSITTVGSITNSYSSGSVSGTENVGGLVGVNLGSGSIATSYSSSAVSGKYDVGGLVSFNLGDNVVSSFWDIQTSRVAWSTGGTGKTTAEMQTAQTFLDAGWDFVGETANGTADIWRILEGKEYPRLAWEYWAFSPDLPNGATDVIVSPTLSWFAARAATAHEVYFGQDQAAVASATPTSVGTYRGRQPLGTTTYDPGDLEWGKTYYWRVDEVNEADPNSPWKGGVWSFTTTACIKSPQPPDGAIDVSRLPVLTWAPAEPVFEYDVYFGEEEKAVAAATRASPGLYRGRQPSEATTYEPGVLKLNTAYYWRIDGVDTVTLQSPWKGNVWSFTTTDSLVTVDDFESYTDDMKAGQAVFQTWLDGYGYGDATLPPYYPGNGTGSAAGYVDAPFAEQEIVHGGKQSMPMDYNDAKPPYYSEAQRTWETPQDWMMDGADTLTLYFRGEPNNSPEPLYMRIEDGGGRMAVAVHPDPNAVLAIEWQKWHIALADVRAAGVDVAAVKEMVIGAGDRNSPKLGGTGRIYIDDIRLTKRMP